MRGNGKIKEPHTTPKVSKSTDGMKPTFNAGRLLVASIPNISLSHNFVYVLNLIYIDSTQAYQNCCVKETVLICSAAMLSR
ncbi:hypothetical protein CJ213_01080 [Gardnerella swidsinskii]|uniref:Uncharacterized protein n=1 Tax=Gardnerella swidsinskii TaxID=2792979 RepID=A0A9X7FF26_9BIFI|nr:hypothetical protein CJ213_01080 [Gardnerella swidsinskii]